MCLLLFGMAYEYFYGWAGREANRSKKSRDKDSG